MRPPPCGRHRDSAGVDVGVSPVGEVTGPRSAAPSPSSPPIPLSEGATGASTTENTASLASSTSCCENRPAWAQSAASAKACSVSAGRGSLGDPRISEPRAGGQ